MPIIVNVDVMLAKRKMQSKELAEKLEITPANLSILKTGKAKGIRFDTLEAICKILDCQPGDILEYVSE
ncbi:MULTISPECIES: helix-turn-helix domain-containing protein [Flavobacterium]|jgi:putative transcriptional regulator|nr:MULTISPECIES: helix-turn-helix transcriptional regulator [Flavobacterium]KAF2338787.1 helix-turn-helix transcriptional regulator [Flavobacterium nitrogenifigens]MBF4467433.1 helix-turn-helix transcriptional regulator [Flavobacterium sp. LC2016-12]MDQ8014364.1 helix-turn-helix transcriptional regulator [Flavobacterium nitrogenifigens]WDF64474.1 helix-turn-helix transcriptional regulator [Flavobacterium sp. KACC 22763]SHM70419.1 putative transcriptional regulator [Flavobacterium saccharophilu